MRLGHPPAIAAEPAAAPQSETTPESTDAKPLIADHREQLEALGAKSVSEALEMALSLKRDLRELQQSEAAAAETINRLRANNAALESKIDELTGASATAGAPPFFVSLGAQEPPCRHSSLERARKRAASLVANHHEAEVLVLMPVGRAVRGAEWKPY